MSLDDLLEELKKEYLATFPAKIVLIDSLYKTQAFTELETEYHKLKGTGRTYGFPEVTQLGEVVERLCEVDREALRVAVPLSLTILTRIQKQREAGEILDIESDPDFLVIVRLVMTASLVPLPPSSPPKTKPTR